MNHPSSMSAAEIIQIITALSTFFVVVIGAVTTAVLTIRNHSAIKKNTVITQDVKTATDGMKDQLVASTAKASLAEGTAIGHAEEKAETKLLKPL